jgi:hypothetical protein
LVLMAQIVRPTEDADKRYTLRIAVDVQMVAWHASRLPPLLIAERFPAARTTAGLGTVGRILPLSDQGTDQQTFFCTKSLRIVSQVYWRGKRWCFATNQTERSGPSLGRDSLNNWQCCDCRANASLLRRNTI